MSNKKESRKGLVPVHKNKVRKCLEAIGRQYCVEDRKSYVEEGWKIVGKYSYRMYQSKIARGGLDYATLVRISEEINNVGVVDLIDFTVPSEWFEQ